MRITGAYWRITVAMPHYRAEVALENVPAIGVLPKGLNGVAAPCTARAGHWTALLAVAMPKC